MRDIPILMIHSVNSKKVKHPMGRLSVSPEGLESYLKVFQRWHYQMISVTDLLNGDYDENKNFIVLTFDDGFKDNLTVARPILEKYHAHATIFVNPAFFSDTSDDDSDWGFMTWDEVKAAENSGIFDVQAHTMTHEFIFVSDKIVDYYTPDKFEKYYWIAWMLFPESPRKWDSDAYSYRDRIPTGYPIFEYGRRIAQKKFVPDQQYVDYIIKSFEENGRLVQVYDGIHGVFEKDEEYKDYITWEIEECKKVLEKVLGKTITTICFPGGGYNDFALDLAKKSGFCCYITASSKRVGKNQDHLQNIRKGQFDCFNRIAISQIHPGLFPNSFYDKWLAKLTLGTFQKKPGYTLLSKIMSKIVHVIMPHQ